jgi:hypothetical protein
LQQLLGAAAGMLGVPYDEANLDEALAERYFLLPSVQLIVEDAAGQVAAAAAAAAQQGMPAPTADAPLDQLSLLTWWFQDQQLHGHSAPHLSMQLALVHAPPTLRGLWAACQYCNMQYMEVLVNRAQGPLWPGALLRALLEEAPGVWWAHCQDRLAAFLQLCPVHADGRREVADRALALQARAEQRQRQRQREQQQQQQQQQEGGRKRNRRAGGDGGDGGGGDSSRGGPAA